MVHERWHQPIDWSWKIRSTDREAAENSNLPEFSCGEVSCLGKTHLFSKKKQIAHGSPISGYTQVRGIVGYGTALLLVVVQKRLAAASSAIFFNPGMVTGGRWSFNMHQWNPRTDHQWTHLWGWPFYRGYWNSHYWSIFVWSWVGDQQFTLNYTFQ